MKHLTSERIKTMTVEDGCRALSTAQILLDAKEWEMALSAALGAKAIFERHCCDSCTAKACAMIGRIHGGQG